MSATASDVARPDADVEELPPEDPRLAQMRRLVTILLVVLIVGVSTVVVALLLKLKDFAIAPVTAGAALERPIPGLASGERLISASTDGERISLVLESASGERRVIFLSADDFAPIGALNDQGQPRNDR